MFAYIHSVIQLNAWIPQRRLKFVHGFAKLSCTLFSNKNLISPTIIKSLKCTVVSVWMHCKEKKQKNQFAVNCTTRRSKLLKLVFKKNYYVTFWWKIEITDLFGLILEMSMHNFVEYSWSFDAKRISYSELGFASRILHHKFMLHGL